MTIAMSARTSKLRVYGYAGSVAHDLVAGRQQRIIVAARSLAEARRILDAGPHTGWPGNAYIGSTANEEELALALSDPGVIYARPLYPSDGRDWVRLPSETERIPDPSTRMTGPPLPHSL